MPLHRWCWDSASSGEDCLHHAWKNGRQYRLRVFHGTYNTSLSGSTELFLHVALERAAEKSSQVLHNEVIRKAVTMEKQQQKPLNNFSFPN